MLQTIYLTLLLPRKLPQLSYKQVSSISDLNGLRNSNNDATSDKNIDAIRIELNKITSRVDGTFFFELPDAQRVPSVTTELQSIEETIGKLNDLQTNLAICKLLGVDFKKFKDADGDVLSGFTIGVRNSDMLTDSFDALASLGDSEIRQALSGGLDLSKVSTSEREILYESGFGSGESTLSILSGDSKIYLGIALVGTQKNPDGTESKSFFHIPLSSNSDTPDTKISDSKLFASEKENLAKEATTVAKPPGRFDNGQIVSLGSLKDEIAKKLKRTVVVDPRLIDSLIYIRGNISLAQKVHLLEIVGSAVNPYEVTYRTEDPSKLSKLFSLLKTRIVSQYSNQILNGLLKNVNLTELAQNGISPMFGNAQGDFEITGVKLQLTLQNSGTNQTILGQTIPLKNSP